MYKKGLELNYLQWLICYKTNQPINLNGGSLKLVDKFTYLGSSISSTESDVSIHIAKVWIDRLSILWKFDLSDKIKRDFFQAVVVSILL